MQVGLKRKMLIYIAQHFRAKAIRGNGHEFHAKSVLHERATVFNKYFLIISHFRFRRTKLT